MSVNIEFNESTEIELSTNNKVVKYNVLSNNYTFSISEVKLDDKEIVRVLKYNQNKCQRVTCNKIVDNPYKKLFKEVRNKYTYIKEYYVNFYNNDLFNWNFVYKHYLNNVDNLLKNKLPNKIVISLYDTFDKNEITYNKSIGLSECLRDDVPTKMYLELTKIPKNINKVNSKVNKVTSYIEKLLVLPKLDVTVIMRNRKNACDVRIIYDNLIMPNLAYCNEVVSYLSHINNIRTGIYNNGTVLDQYGTLKKSMGINIIRNDTNNKFILVQPEFNHKDITFLKDVYLLKPIKEIDILKVRQSGLLETDKVDNNFMECKLLKECGVCKSSHENAYVLRYEYREYLCCPHYGKSKLLMLPYLDSIVDGSDFACDFPEKEIEEVSNKYIKYINTEEGNNNKEVLKLKYATTLLMKLSDLTGLKNDKGFVAYSRLYEYKKYNDVTLKELQDAFSYLYEAHRIKDNEFKRLYYSGGKTPNALPENYDFRQFNGLLKSMLRDTYKMEPSLNKPNIRKGAVSLDLVYI